MRLIIVIIFSSFLALPSFGLKGQLPDVFSFKASNSGKMAGGEYYQDNFTVTALGQVFWETSSNSSGPCPLLAGRLKGKLSKQELTDFALLAKESLLELEKENEGHSSQMLSSSDSRLSHEWKLTYGDQVYSQPIDGGKQKVQELQDIIQKIKTKLNASSIVYMETKEKKDGSFDIIFNHKGVGPFALVFSNKVSDTFSGGVSDWKYLKKPPTKVVLNDQIRSFKVNIVAPKGGQRPTHFIYSNASLVDHYESSELGDQAGYRPIKVCAPL